MLTFKPVFLRSVAIEAAAMPLPSELSTPPVIKIYFVSFGFFCISRLLIFCAIIPYLKFINA